ncbi:hypothetical protein AMECASPLE_034358, partial [Ameca splendens]
RGHVAASINREFRRIDKVVAGVPGARVIVTDSWIMKVTTYHIYTALQSDCHVTVTESRQHQLSPDLTSPIEILTLRVESINPAVRPFNISLNSADYTDFREKLRAPIRTSPNVVIHQTISELFLETFRAQVELNQRYKLPNGQEVEPCIGCMQVPASTKLVRLCQTAGMDNESECQQCFCRPMWCLFCLGRWFASRQDQQRLETWLSSKVPCPTCRAKFCILDVYAGKEPRGNDSNANLKNGGAKVRGNEKLKVNMERILQEIQDFRKENNQTLNGIKEELNKTNQPIEKAETRITEARDNGVNHE